MTEGIDPLMVTGEPGGDWRCPSSCSSPGNETQNWSSWPASNHGKQRIISHALLVMFLAFRVLIRLKCFASLYLKRLFW